EIELVARSLFLDLLAQVEGVDLDEPGLLVDAAAFGGAWDGGERALQELDLARQFASGGGRGGIVVVVGRRLTEADEDDQTERRRNHGCSQCELEACDVPSVTVAKGAGAFNRRRGKGECGWIVVGA